MTRVVCLALSIFWTLIACDSHRPVVAGMASDGGVANNCALENPENYPTTVDNCHVSITCDEGWYSTKVSCDKSAVHDGKYHCWMQCLFYPNSAKAKNYYHTNPYPEGMIFFMVMPHFS